MPDSQVSTQTLNTQHRRVAVALCLLVVMCSLAVAAWTLGTGQIKKQGIDAIFILAVCLTFAGAFSIIPLQAMRASGISITEVLLGPEESGEALAAAAAETAHEAGGLRLFSTVWIYLLALTAIEVFLSYVHLFSTAVMLLILMVLSLFKAALIVAYFMHMKYERKSFIVSILPAVVVVMSLLFMFFPDGFRALALRP